MEKTGAEPARQLQKLVQALFIEHRPEAVLSLVTEDIRWHSTEPDCVYIGRQDLYQHILRQTQRHQEILVSLPQCSEVMLNDTERLLTCEVLLQNQTCHSVYVTAIQNIGGLFSFVQISSAHELPFSPKREQTLTILPDQMPGGIFHCLFDEPLTLLQTSDSFLALTGYTREEIQSELHNSFRQLIDPRDYDRTISEVQEQLSHGDSKEIQFRLRRKHQEPIWVLDKGRYLEDQWGRRYFCCILVDITESKKVQEELRLSLERYEIIMNQTRDIIFEWNIDTDQLTFSVNWEKQFHRPAVSDIRTLLDAGNHWLFPEERQKLLNLRSALLDGREVEEQELRLLENNQIPVWYKLRVTAQTDDSQRPVKAIGILTNIDKDKQLSDQLLEKAQRDALTQFYNKEAIQLRIEDLMQDEKFTGGALMIIDIDDFKKVNDTFGHLFGDAFLIEATSRIHQLFRKEDLLGRIGGDEFLIFLNNVTDRRVIEDKARQIIEAFHAIEVHSQAIPFISCSIGIVLVSPHQDTYHQLFQKADQALYSIKDTGKNRFAFYQENLSQLSVDQLSSGMSAVSARIDSDSSDAAYSQLSNYVFRTLYQTEHLEEAIQNILEVIGLHFDVSRVYIFENTEDDTHCCNTFEWCNEGIIPEKQNLQYVSYAENLNGIYLENFDENGIFYCQDIYSLSPGTIEILQPQNIKSMLQCAIKDQGVFKGYIGFDECREKRLWNKDQIQVLTYAAEILSIFLLKKRAQERIQRLEQLLYSLPDR